MAGGKRKADAAINVTDELSETYRAEGGEKLFTGGARVEAVAGAEERYGYGYGYGYGHEYGYGYGEDVFQKARRAEKSADESKGTIDNTPSF